MRIAAAPVGADVDTAYEASAGVNILEGIVIGALKKGNKKAALSATSENFFTPVNREYSGDPLVGEQKSISYLRERGTQLYCAPLHCGREHIDH